MPITVNFNLPRMDRSAQPRRLVRATDGDTTVIEQPIRMVSCDTPEKGHYAGNPPVRQYLRSNPSIPTVDCSRTSRLGSPGHRPIRFLCQRILPDGQ
jgi:endonuclease YncB( thermonuclease family)